MSESKFISDSTEFNAKLRALDASSLVVLTDNNTSQHCLHKITDNALNTINFHHIELPHGEGTKTLDSAKSVWNQLIELEIDRSAIIVCLGGGMICDLGGYVASCYKRGIRTVYIPTTNLAMTDAALGGKTGVNFGSAKNQIGTFHLPELVLIDTKFLETLPNEELLSGFAETIKHALVADKQLWEDIHSTIEPWADMDIIHRSARIKLDIVENDLHDLGVRQALNFGHTIGHAIEAISHATSSPLLHGQAILYGIAGEAWISHQKKLLSKVDLQSITSYLSKLIDDIPLPKMNHDDIMESMIQDKKNTNGQIIFTLIDGIGSSKQGISIKAALILGALQFISKMKLN